MAEGSPSRLGQSSDIVKSGWLLKRGEHIKNWRERYFVLLKNGSLLGFKTDKDIDIQTTKPLNDFTVKECQILKTEHPRPNAFILRGLHWSTVIERKFSASCAEDRKDWIRCIENVKNSLEYGGSSRHCPEYYSDDCESLEDLDYDDTRSDVSKRKLISLEDFEFIKLLGKGTFGKVLLCRDKSTHSIFALKILRKDIIIKRDEVAHTITESKVMQKVNHPFLTRMRRSFTTEDRLCFVLEYVNGGELFFHLRQERIFSEDRTRFYGAEICSALKYLHERNIIYRDLKLENILLDVDGHIKIADFGLCKENITNESKTATFCGTPEYLAPEILRDFDYGPSVDWWGYGVCLYEMMVGRLPFYDSNHEKLFEMIVTTDIKFPKSLTRHAVDILKQLLVKDPDKRLGGSSRDALDVMEHPFYATINWKLVEERKLIPPFKPDVKDPTDTKYFDSEFTALPVDLTPPDRCNSDLNVIDEESTEFMQFSYRDSSTENSLVSSFSSVKSVPIKICILKL